MKSVEQLGRNLTDRVLVPIQMFQKERKKKEDRTPRVCQVLGMRHHGPGCEGVGCVAVCNSPPNSSIWWGDTETPAGWRKTYRQHRWPCLYTTADLARQATERGLYPLFHLRHRVELLEAPHS